MDPYVFAVLERAAQEARVRAAPHTWHLDAVRAERAAARRFRRFTSARALVAMLWRFAHHVRIPASAGGRT